MRKLENSFRSLLKDSNVTHLDNWESVKPKVEDNSAFNCIPNEADRVRIFKVRK